MKSPISRVTIIVCSCNRERLLAETIHSITGLRKPRQAHIEVIVVDNASTDNTPLIINNLASPFPIQYVREERLGHSIALNRGVRESKGELLLFTDDDALVDVDWLFEYWRYANAYREAGYFFSKIIPIFPKEPPDWWKLTPRSLSGRNQGDHVIRFDYFCWESYPIGVNMAFMRKALPGNKPFNESLGPSRLTGLMSGADTDLGKRIMMKGYPSYYVPTATVYHRISPERMTWSYAVKRAYCDGRASAKYRVIQGENAVVVIRGKLIFVILMDIILGVANLLLGRRLRFRKQFLEAAKTCGACRGFKEIPEE